MELSANEGRVLGCLLEKQATTPDLYPLTLNSLVNACNQTSNRNPVLHLDASEVDEAIVALKQQGLARSLLSPSNRATKFRHVVDETLGLDKKERALVCVLLLRGPQTLGEIKTRTERMVTWNSIDEVEAELERLAVRGDEPLVVRLPRAPGQKEARYAQLLTGEPDLSAATSAPPDTTPRADRVAALEQEVAELRDEVGELRRQLQDLVDQLT